MKSLSIIVFICCFFATLHLLAQSPVAVEADIVSSFNKIAYWNGYRFKNIGSTDTSINAIDSVGKADKAFRQKLGYYASKYPFTLSLEFKELENSFLKILTSDDGLFRIYSWDNNSGGSMRRYENVFQYKADSNVKVKVNADTDEMNRNYYYDYSNLYTLKANGHVYYLALYNGRFSRKDLAEGLQVFSIENGKLTDSVNIIKTPEGMHSKLSYYFNLFAVPDKKIDKYIRYDETSKIISLPIVAEHGKMTNARMAYKFTGQYFEVVKN